MIRLRSEITQAVGSEKAREIEAALLELMKSGLSGHTEWRARQLANILCERTENPQSEP